MDVDFRVQLERFNAPELFLSILEVNKKIKGTGGDTN